MLKSPRRRTDGDIAQSWVRNADRQRERQGRAWGDGK